MKKILVTFSLIVFGCLIATHLAAAAITIVPQPMSVVQKQGSFRLTSATHFSLQNDSLFSVSDFFCSKIQQSTGFRLKTNNDSSSVGVLRLAIDGRLKVNDEGYSLSVLENQILIKAKTKHGLFNAMQSLMQLLPPQIESERPIRNMVWKIPCVDILDEPRFAYRGFMLDACRHFFSVDFIKKQLDVMAMYKINKFHFHLTDDQGWRIQIKRYPKLTQLGAKRIDGDGKVYGPYFYTQDQIKDIVRYAQQRFIDVVPEIEMPGHAVAALTAYPQYACRKGPFSVRNIWGVSHDLYCAGNDSVFQFIHHILDEVVPLFPYPYFHIGGDECPKDRWKNCALCQARIKSLGIKADSTHTPEAQLQSYFVQRVQKLLSTYGKRLIGWDEILEGGIAKSATVMSWRGEQGGIDAANLGHDVIMTPDNYLYFNYYQGEPKVNPTTIGGDVPLEKAYSYDPIPTKIADSEKWHVIGTQANIWAEYMYRPQLCEFQMYPRMLALAEVAWSKPETKDYGKFLNRLDDQRCRLDRHHIAYYIPIPQQADAPSCNYVAFTDRVTLKFKTTEPVAMVYTLDGTVPGRNSKQYTSGLTFKKSAILKIRSLLGSGKMSKTRTIQVVKEHFAPSSDPKRGHLPGLTANYYRGRALKIQDIAAQPTKTERVASPQQVRFRVNDDHNLNKNDYYSCILDGYFKVAANAVYYFSSDADQVWIDGHLFIVNPGIEAKRYSHHDKSVALAKGYHKIKVVQLGNSAGGWPTQFNEPSVSIRRDSEPKFGVMNRSYFE